MQAFIKQHPAIAILRGILPDTVIPIAQCLYQHGIRVIEVPLNSPNAITSIAKLAETLPNDCLIGAGTVTSTEQVKQVADVGGQVIISPHCDPNIIQQCHHLSLQAVPGIATPTEAYNAYQAGAKWLKLFPAATYGFGHIKALKSILPSDANIIAVGGVNAENSQQWLLSGANALGIGNSLFQTNDTLAQVQQKVTEFNRLLHSVSAQNKT